MFTREDKNSKIKPKQSMHIKSRSNKTNEWPLMSTPINKSMPRKRLLKMRINEKIINYRSRTWKASSQAKALLTSSSVSRSLRKNPLPNISFLLSFLWQPVLSSWASHHLPFAVHHLSSMAS